MKRIFTLLAAITVIFGAMAQTSGIMLSKDKGKKLMFFKADQLKEAIEEATPNDTIYLAPGDYSIDRLESSTGYGRDITKPITLIGAGGAYKDDGGTRFPWDALILNIGNEYDPSEKNITIEGIKCDYELRINSDMNEVILRNCDLQFNCNNDEADVTGKDIQHLIIDRCNLGMLDLEKGRIANAQINNTKINNRVYGYCSANDGAAVFDHCFVYVLDESFVGQLNHSLIDENYSGEKPQFIDSVCDNIYDSDNNHIGYVDSATDNDPSSLGNCSDGTPYGTSGGSTPFSLYPSYPTPDARESVIDYDGINKKITVTIKLLGE